VVVVLPVPLTVAVVPDALAVPIGVVVLVPITDTVEAPDTVSVTRGVELKVPLRPVGITDELALSDAVCEDETLVLALPVIVRLSRADALRVGVVELEGHPVEVPRPDKLGL
jgi:hypothetical protein